MRKLISAVFLALMALIQVHAQDSELRSAPDLPTFKVTLKYSSANLAQGTITSTIATDSKVAYGSTPAFTITAKAGYVLSDITINTVSISTLPTGTFKAEDNTTTYSYTSAALTGSTEIKAMFKEKDPVTVTISPEYATLDEIKAKVNLPKVTLDPAVTGYKVQYKEEKSGTLTDNLPEKAGLYQVVVTKAETDTQAAINKEILFKIQPPHTLTYSFEKTQGTVSATMNGSSVASGGEIAYDKTAVLKITSKPGYVLSKLTVDNKEVALPAGTFNPSTNETAYADYTTSALKTSMSISVEFTAKKAVSVSASPLSATKDEIAAGKKLPDVTFTPSISGQKYQFKNASGTLMDKLPATDGVYTIVATSPETADYAALTDESNKFTISQANKLSWSVEGQGTVTAKMGGKDVSSGGDIANGESAVLTIIAKPGYKLSEIKIAGKPANLPTGTFNSADNTITYTHTTEALTASATINVTFTEKMKVTAKVTGSSATEDQVVAKQNLPVIKFDPEMNGQAVAYRATNGTETKELPAVAGIYKIVLTSPETMVYAALTDSSNTFTVANANALVYTVDGGNGMVTAKMDGKNVDSGAPIAYGKPAVFSIVSNANYKLGAIKQGSSDVDISKIAGTYANGKTSYTYTTPNLTAGAGYTFVFASKDTVKLVANNLIQTVGSIKPVTVTSTAPGIKIEYQLNGTAWVEALPSTLAVGSYKARFTRAEDLTYRSLSDTASLIVESKKDVANLVLPKASVIEQYQSLSASILTGGTAPADIPGTFGWMNPDTIADPHIKYYGLVFQPDDNALYAAKDTFIPVTVIPVYTMKASAGNFGNVKQIGRTANDRYREGATLQLEAIADKNYEFVSWSDGNKSASRTLISGAKKDTVDIEARFDSIKHSVTIETPVFGKIDVQAGEASVQSGTSWLQGTPLTITATPNEGYMVESILVNGAVVNGGLYNLDKASTITATFTAKPAERYWVNVNALKNGSVTLIETDTKAPITSGAAVENGMSVTVIATPNYGYEVGTITYTGAASSTGNKFTVGSSKVEVTVPFNKVSYPVTTKTNIVDAGTVTLTKVEAGSYANNRAEYQTKLVAKATVNTGYRLLNMMVNTSEIKSGDTLVVDGPVTVTANYQKKVDLAAMIDTKEQTTTYNTQEQSFAVKVPKFSGLQFNTTYFRGNDKLEGRPKDAGTYTVKISRDEDDVFAAVSVERIFTIQKANMALTSIEYDPATKTLTSAELTQKISTITWGPSTKATKSLLRSSLNIVGTPRPDQVNPIVFGTNSGNYNPLYYYVPVGNVETVSLTVSTNGVAGANVKVTNGGLEVTDLTNIPAGTTLTLRAIAPDGYRFVSWDDETAEAERSITLSAAATYKATFAPKQEVGGTKTKETVYNGSTQLFGLSDFLSGTGYPSDIAISYYKGNGDGASATPMNAGIYTVKLTRAADATWKEVNLQTTLTINKAEVTITPPTASDIVFGQALNESILSGGMAVIKSSTTSVLGKFEWVDPSEQLAVGSKTANVKFVSYDENYKDAMAKANIEVKASDALIITFSQPENGTVSVFTLDTEGKETAIVSGTAVAKDSKLRVKVTPKDGYELEKLQIGNTSYTTSTVTVDGVTTSLAIYATLRITTSPGDPSGIAVTGVSLSTTEKMMAVGESFALAATVSPSNASIKSVSWSSSDETVATVDVNGVVTALKIGTCKITVATDDGNKTASCRVTVSGTVSIEQIFGDHQVYSVRGAITVSPARPISIRIIAVTGADIYGGSITGTTRIPVSTGIYLVEIIENGKHMTTKVNVR
ncbi:Ig-like domain-containing protein [Parabacteroides sp.]